VPLLSQSHGSARVDVTVVNDDAICFLGPFARDQTVEVVAQYRGRLPGQGVAVPATARPDEGDPLTWSRPVVVGLTEVGLVALQRGKAGGVRPGLSTVDAPRVEHVSVLAAHHQGGTGRGEIELEA